MLTEQKGDWDFQEYVVPHHRAADGAYRPLTVHQMSALLTEVKALAGLPDDLRVGDLRKTAIVQMIESGVDHLAIQSVSGHKNVTSLNPYNKCELVVHIRRLFGTTNNMKLNELRCMLLQVEDILLNIGIVASPQICASPAATGTEVFPIKRTVH